MAPRLLVAPRARAVVLAASLAASLAACGAAEPSPAPPPAARPTTSAASATSTVAPSLVELGAAASAASALAPLEPQTNLPPVPGRFEPVTLPAGTPPLVAVAGRAADDVWMLDGRGNVLRWDGARLTGQGAPRCFTDSCCGRLFDCKRSPSKCTAAAVADCQIGRADCAWEAPFQGLRLAAGEIVAVSTVDTGGITQSTVESRRRPDGRWTCEQPRDDGLLHASLTRASPSVVLEERVRFGPNYLGDPGLVVEGRRVPLPPDLGLRDLDLVAPAPHDLWLWERSDTDGARLWHGNGLSWQPVPVAVPGIADAWPAGPGAMWILGMPGDGVDELLVHLAPDTPPRAFAVPGATRRLQGSGGAFWLVARTAVYHWDGRVLSRADIPLDFVEPTEQVVQAQDPVWLDPSGALWVVGAHRTARIKTPGAPVPAGAAFRFSSSPAEKRP